MLVQFCQKCANKYFREYTLTTLVLGWWGIISVFATPIVLLIDVVSYLRARSLAPVPTGAKKIERGILTQNYVQSESAKRHPAQMQARPVTSVSTDNSPSPSTVPISISSAPLMPKPTSSEQPIALRGHFFQGGVLFVQIRSATARAKALNSCPVLGAQRPPHCNMEMAGSVLNDPTPTSASISCWARRLRCDAKPIVLIQRVSGGRMGNPTGNLDT